MTLDLSHGRAIRLIAVDRKGVQGFLEEHEESLPPLVRREVRTKLKTGKKNPASRA